MIVSVDPSRAGEGDFAEGERERLMQLASRFSREDLMRSFDLLSKAEQDVRVASHPRYQFEMVLLKWMHTRKLVPLAELLEGAGSSKSQIPSPKSQITAHVPTGNVQLPRKPAAAPVPARAAVRAPEPSDSRTESTPPGTHASANQSNLKDQLLAEIRSKKALFYNTVVAQAQRIEVDADRVIFTFLPTHRALREQLEATRPWLEAAAEKIGGRKMSVVAVQSDAAGSAVPAAGASGTVAPDRIPNPDSRLPTPDSRLPTPGTADDKKRDLKAEAMSSATVQAMLDVFPAEIRDVEEM
jgi:DNA polymerase-3 subunit gamma/tau